MTEPTLRNRFHHILRTLVSERPAIYLPFARRKYPGPSPEVIGPETEFVIDGYTRSASTFAAVCDVASPTTSPLPASRHFRAICATVRVLPEPAGPAITSARRGEVSTANAAAAWSRRSPDPVTSPVTSNTLPTGSSACRPVPSPAPPSSASSPRRSRIRGRALRSSPSSPSGGEQ